MRVSLAGFIRCFRLSVWQRPWACRNSDWDAGTSSRGEGVEHLAKKAVDVARKSHEPVPITFDQEVEDCLKQIETLLPATIPGRLRRFHAIKVFERDEYEVVDHGMRKSCEEFIAKVEADLDDRSDAIITNERYRLHHRLHPARCRKRPSGAYRFPRRSTAS